MAASTFHSHMPHARGHNFNATTFAYGWPHKVAAGLLVAIGAAFVAITVAANLFSVGPAFDRLTNDFRPQMTQQAIQTDRQDIAALSGASNEIQNRMLPALAQQMGVAPAQFSASLATQYPAVMKGLTAIPQVTPMFDSLVTTLDEQRPYFAAADSIPTASIPATSVPWSLFAVGLVSIGLGCWVWSRPRGAAIAVTLVGALLVAVPLALSLPHKASYADTLNTNLKPVYTQEMITQADSALATLSAMGTEMQTKMLPALATQLHMTPAQLGTFFAANFPTTNATLAGMPASMGRFQTMVGAFSNRLDDYNTMKPVTLAPIVWFLIGGGASLFLLGGAGVVITQRSGRAKA